MLVALVETASLLAAITGKETKASIIIKAAEKIKIDRLLILAATDFKLNSFCLVLIIIYLLNSSNADSIFKELEALEATALRSPATDDDATTGALSCFFFSDDEASNELK